MGPPQDDVTPRTPSSQRRVYRECIPPPPASWPAANRNPCGRSSGAAGAPALPLPTREGFCEQIEVFVPGRAAKFLVRVAGRELAATNGVAVVLHGVRFFRTKHHSSSAVVASTSMHEAFTDDD